MFEKRLAVLILDHLPKCPRHVSLSDILHEVERLVIKLAMEENEWVTAQAAVQLGLNRTTLVEKCKKIKFKVTEERRAISQNKVQRYRRQHEG